MVETRTVVAVSAASVAVAIAGSLIYFDYKRRNDPEFRKKLRKEKKKAAKNVKDGETATPAAPGRSQEELKELLAKVNAEPLPTLPAEREKYFMDHVGMGEQLLLRGPAFEVPASLAFYRALRAYPSPVEIIMIFQNTLPAHIFSLVMELASLDVSSSESALAPETALAQAKEPTPASTSTTAPVPERVPTHTPAPASVQGTESEHESEVMVEADVETEVEVEVESEAEVETRAEVMSEAEVISETEVVTEAHSEPETEDTAEVDEKAEAKDVAHAQVPPAEPEPEDGAEAEAKPGPEPEPEPATEPAPESEPESTVVSEPTPESEPAPVHEPTPESEPKPGRESEPATAPHDPASIPLGFDSEDEASLDAHSETDSSHQMTASQDGHPSESEWDQVTNPSESHATLPPQHTD